MKAPRCSRCGTPLLKWVGAIECLWSGESAIRILCRKCFHEGIGGVVNFIEGPILLSPRFRTIAFQLFELIDPSIDSALLESLEGQIGHTFPRLFKNSPVKAVAALSLIYSIQGAKKNGVFLGVGYLLDTAMRVVLPQHQAASFTIRDMAYKILTERNLWVPLRPSKLQEQEWKKPGRPNKMLLGKRVCDLTQRFTEEVANAA